MAKKTDTEPAKKQRFAQIRQIKDAYAQTAKVDKKLTPIMIGIVVGIIAVFVIIALLVTHTVWGRLLWILPGVMLAVLVAVIVLGRRMEKAAYRQIEGQPGAAGAALGGLRRGWNVTPAIAANRNQDVVHRVVGKPGIILVGEGAPSRVKHLLTAEKKKHIRVAGGAPVTEIIAGDDEGQVPLRKLTSTIIKMDAVLTPQQITGLLNRIKAIDASQPKIPMPKGPMPQNARQAMRGARQAAKGR